MNKLHIDINNNKKIISIDITGELNQDIIEKHINKMRTRVDYMSPINPIDFKQWRINIYFCHLELYKEDLIYLEELLDVICLKDAKLINLIFMKPQKKYKMWLGDIIQKRFYGHHMKCFSSDHMFKFN